MQRQGGFVLVSVLIFLALITVIVLSTMQSAGLEVGVTDGMCNKLKAFHAAEEGLLLAQEVLSSQKSSVSQEFHPSSAKRLPAYVSLLRDKSVSTVIQGGNYDDSFAGFHRGLFFDSRKCARPIFDNGATVDYQEQYLSIDNCRRKLYLLTAVGCYQKSQVTLQEHYLVDPSVMPKGCGIKKRVFDWVYE